MFALLLSVCFPVAFISAQQVQQDQHVDQPRLEKVFEWTKLQFRSRNEFQSHGLLGSVRHHEGQLYVAVPRLRDPDIPTTLATIDMRKETGKSPELVPFPDVSANQVGADCDALQNVMAIEVSPDGRLWAADNGVAGIFKSPVGQCPAKLVVFDLRSTKETATTTTTTTTTTMAVYRYSFPDAVVSSRRGKSILVHMAVDFSASEDNPMIYLADMSSGRLVVVDTARSISWFQTAESTMAASMVSVSVGQAGQEQVNLRSGITGLAIQSNVKGEMRRHLYFSTFSKTLFSIPLEVVTNSTLVNVDSFVRAVGRRPASSDGMTSDDRGFIYFGAQGSNAVLRWNSTNNGREKEFHDPFGTERHVFLEHLSTLVASGDFEWINSLSIDADSNLWIGTNNFHKFIYSDLSNRLPNFRIFRFKLDNGVKPYMTEFISSASSISNTSLLSVSVIIGLLKVIRVIIY